MDFLLFAAFLTTTLLFVAVPGPSVAFASAQAVKHGSRAAVVTVAGDALGTMVHIIVAVGSLTALMALATLVLPFLQIVGGLFIVYMAYRSVSVKHLASAYALILAGFVGHYVGFAGDVLLQDRDKRCLFQIINDDGLGALSLTIHQCQHFHLAIAATSVLGLGHARLFVDERFVNFHDTTVAAEASQRTVTHAFADAVGQEPCRLIGDAQNPV
jgi:Co/Zn/Cd efflux system component